VKLLETFCFTVLPSYFVKLDTFEITVNCPSVKTKPNYVSQYKSEFRGDFGCSFTSGLRTNQKTFHHTYYSEIFPPCQQQWFRNWTYATAVVI